MTLDEALNRVHLGRSIAFLGAGFSRDATNLLDQAMLSGGGLSKKLSEALGEDDLPLSISSQLYARAGLTPSLQELIRSGFTAATVEPYHRTISNLPWRRVYTTNYDNVVETCRREAGSSVNSATVLDKPANFAGMFSVVHLHGFVERLTVEDWDQA